MAQYIDKDALVAEIKKLHGNPFYMMAVKDVLAILDSLQEEPVSDDFEMALAEMIDKAQTSVVEPWVVAAQWKDELIKLAKSEEPVSDELEKAAEEYAYTNWASDDYHEGAAEGLPFDAIGHTEKCFKAGAKWQKEREDSGLTVDDIMKIDALLIDMWNQPENKYQEVLKRFRNFKERKENDIRRH